MRVTRVGDSVTVTGDQYEMGMIALALYQYKGDSTVPDEEGWEAESNTTGDQIAAKIDHLYEWIN